jgi:hypothetical protein
MMGRGIMARPELSPGEAAERARKQRIWTIIGGLFVAGMAVGFLTARFEVGDGGLLEANLPPTFALIAALFTGAVLIGGSLLFHRRIDEVERRHNMLAGTIGANALLVGYPIWFILWKGGWVPEPQHWMLFAMVYLVVTTTYLWSKFR